MAPTRTLVSTRDSTSTHFPDRFRLVIGRPANQAAITVASGIGEATVTPDLSARMFAAGDMHALTRAVVGAIGVPVSGLSIAAVWKARAGQTPMHKRCFNAPISWTWGRRCGRRVG